MRAGAVSHDDPAAPGTGGTGGVGSHVRLDLPAGISLTLSAEVLEPLVDLLADRLAARLDATRTTRDPWLTRAQANDYIAGGEGRMDDLVAQGVLRPAWDGSKSLFRRSWLDAYLMGEEHDGVAT